MYPLCSRPTSGSRRRIDWGYFHLGIPRSEESALTISLDPASEFGADGKLAASDTMDLPQPADRRSPHLAAVLDFGPVGTQPVNRHLLMAYTEGYAIQYLQRNLRPYWQRNGMTVEDMLDAAEEQYATLDRKAAAFDADLTSDLTKVGGENYAELAVLAYRQTLAAHALAADVDGRPMLFPKENFSNGCIRPWTCCIRRLRFFFFFSQSSLKLSFFPCWNMRHCRGGNFRSRPMTWGNIL